MSLRTYVSCAACIVVTCSSVLMILSRPTSYLATAKAMWFCWLKNAGRMLYKWWHVKNHEMNRMSRVLKLKGQKVNAPQQSLACVCRQVQNTVRTSELTWTLWSRLHPVWWREDLQANNQLQTRGSPTSSRICVRHSICIIAQEFRIIPCSLQKFAYHLMKWRQHSGTFPTPSSHTFECIDELQVGSRSNLPSTECQILCGSLAMYTTLSSRRSSNVAPLSGNAQLKWRPKIEQAGIQNRICHSNFQVPTFFCIATQMLTTPAAFNQEVRQNTLCEEKPKSGACLTVSECSIHVLRGSTRHTLITKYFQLAFQNLVWHSNLSQEVVRHLPDMNYIDGCNWGNYWTQIFQQFQFHEISTSNICSDLDTLKGSVRPLVEPVWALSIQFGNQGAGWQNEKTKSKSKRTISTSLRKGSQGDKDIASESQSVGNFWFWECDQSMVQQFTNEGNIRTLRRRPTNSNSTSNAPNRSRQHSSASYASRRGVGNSHQSARRPGPWSIWSIGWAWLGSNDASSQDCSDRYYRENVNACYFNKYSILQYPTVNKGD